MTMWVSNYHISQKTIQQISSWRLGWTGQGFFLRGGAREKIFGPGRGSNGVLRSGASRRGASIPASRNHLKTHSGEKSNKCNQCDYASSQAGHLRQHLKTHSGEKSNKCNHCDYASSHPSDLRRHLKKHHGEKSNK